MSILATSQRLFALTVYWFDVRLWFCKHWLKIRYGNTTWQFYRSGFRPSFHCKCGRSSGIWSWGRSELRLFRSMNLLSVWMFLSCSCGKRIAENWSEDLSRLGNTSKCITALFLEWINWIWAVSTTQSAGTLLRTNCYILPRTGINFRPSGLCWGDDSFKFLCLHAYAGQVK